MDMSLIESGIIVCTEMKHPFLVFHDSVITADFVAASNTFISLVYLSHQQLNVADLNAK